MSDLQQAVPKMAASIAHSKEAHQIQGSLSNQALIMMDLKTVELIRNDANPYIVVRV